MSKKSEQLGMPFGTACGRLRNQIMFSLVVECNKNFCVRCKKEILFPLELSIDHIKPRSKYPHLALRLSNVQVLELGLNKTKGARIVKDWRPLKWKAYYILLNGLSGY